jgi:DNA-binding response OmpR family regulator/HPt (histidine-containing phosphotransfer) domain-containing protein
MRVLVVDDDKEVAGLLARDLDAQGYTVDTVGLAQHALAATDDTDYALMVVDLGLPDGDGLELVREIRHRGSHTPILVVTARRRIEDRVAGLATGADDYLVKPFALAELRARVTALLRRPAHLDRTRISIGNLMIDRNAMEASVGGRGMDLTRKQFALLELFARRKGQITPKRMIEERLYGFDDAVSPNAIEAHVSKLRVALSKFGAGITIETRRGIGYRLTATDVPQGRPAEPPAASTTTGGHFSDFDGSFRQRLADDRAGLAMLRAKIGTGGDRVFAALATLAHQLAGAAGTFGYDAIGDAAAAVEERAEAARDASGAHRNKLAPRVASEVERLIALIDGAGTDLDKRN